MARKPNYDFERRRREMERKAKKDAKSEARKERKRLGIEEPEEVIDLSDYGIVRPEGTTDEPAAPGTDDPARGA